MFLLAKASKSIPIGTVLIDILVFKGTRQLLAAALHHDADRLGRRPEKSLLTAAGIPQ